MRYEELTEAMIKYFKECKEPNKMNILELITSWEKDVKSCLEEPGEILQVLNDLYIDLHDEWIPEIFDTFGDGTAEPLQDK